MSHHEKLKRMIDDNKIEEAANLHRFELIASMHGSTLGTPMQCFEEVVDAETELIENSFITGAKWAIKESLKDLWHPMQEEPKIVGEEIIIDEFLEGKRYPMVQKYMVGVEFPPTIETIRWISNWDSFLSEICDEVKMIRWCYFKDLLPKEGGEQ